MWSLPEEEFRMKLSQEAQAKAQAFLFEQARPLERSLYSYHFQGGDREEVFTELAPFQNPDGGFGHGLEPDVRLPDSSVIVTTVGLQILRELNAAEDHPLVPGAIRYLLDTYNSEHEGWLIIPETVDKVPHAPWWQYDGDLSKCRANPRAEIIGYFFDYSGLVSGDLRDRLVAVVLSHLDTLPDAMEMHDLLCYIRLAETKTLPEAARAKIMQKLTRAVGCVVAREPDQWEGYGLKPLMVVTSPDAPFAQMLAQETNLNLDYEIGCHQEDGSWAPNWSWSDAFPEAWPEAEREWKGVLTVETLKTLRNFGRLE